MTDAKLFRIDDAKFEENDAAFPLQKTRGKTNAILSVTSLMTTYRRRSYGITIIDTRVLSSSLPVMIFDGFKSKDDMLSWLSYNKVMTRRFVDRFWDHGVIQGTLELMKGKGLDVDPTNKESVIAYLSQPEAIAELVETSQELFFRTEKKFKVFIAGPMYNAKE